MCHTVTTTQTSLCQLGNFTAWIWRKDQAGVSSLGKERNTIDDKNNNIIQIIIIFVIIQSLICSNVTHSYKIIIRADL